MNSLARGFVGVFVAVLGAACSITVPDGAAGDGFEVRVRAADAGAPSSSKPNEKPAPGTTAPGTTTPPGDSDDAAALCAKLFASKEPDGSFTVDETLGTHTSNLVDVYARYDEWDDPTQGHMAGVEVVLTSTRHTCAFLANNLSDHDEHETKVTFQRPQKAGERLPLGTYGTGPTDLLNVQYLDGTRCTSPEERIQRRKDGNPDNGGYSDLKAGVVTGSLTITKLTADHIEGSFDVVVENGAHFKGTYSAPICPRNGKVGDPIPYCCVK